MGEMNTAIKLMSAHMTQMEKINNDLSKCNEELERRLVENERLTFSDGLYTHVLHLYKRWHWLNANELLIFTIATKSGNSRSSLL